ncbi:MAG: alpha/beta hydrolase [Chloroflexota bacterium]|nr:alpha/beta hydrolase [Chloroflexota bacterium]
MEIDQVLDIPYGQAGNRTLAMDMVLPGEPREEAIPAVLWLHGGGWYSGNKRNVIASGMLDCLPQAGFALVSAEYRLSGEALFPAQIHDVKAALRFLRANAAALGIDAERIAVAGFSAGAHLAALAATSQGVADLEGDCGSAGYSTRVAAAMILAAPTDFLRNPRATDPALNPHAAAGHPCAEHLLLGGPVLERVEGARQANPLHYIGPDMPPCLIVHGREDEIVPLTQAELLYGALKDANAEVTFLEVEDGNHGFWEAGQPYPREPLPPLIRQWIVQFLQKHLQNRAGFSLPDRHTVRVAQLRAAN